jgi:radical SAM superfamily enzyme YgiQ (UPF0313 family)
VSEDLVGPSDEEFHRLLGFLGELREAGTLPAATTLYGAMKVSDICASSDSPERCKTKRDRLELLRAIGFRTLYVGFESGSDSQLRRYGKRSRRHDNVRAIELLRSVEISIDGGFITFDPLASLQEIEENLEFLEEVRVPKLLLFPFNSLEVIPGTGYARLYQRRDNADPAARRLFALVQDLQSRLNFTLLERFLQELRLRYFAGDLLAARPYEELSIEYGIRAIRFLRTIMALLRQNREEADLTARVAEYKEEAATITARMFELLADTTKFSLGGGFCESAPRAMHSLRPDSDGFVKTLPHV